MSNEFLKNLKVHDDVGVLSRNDPRVDSVKKITKTMIVLEKHGRFNRESGKAVGESIWTTSYITEPTEEFLHDYYVIRYKNLIRHYINKGNLNNLDLKELKTIYNTLKGEK